MSRWVESVERRIAAPADQLYALVADPGRHKDFDGSGALVRAIGISTPDRPLGIGDTTLVRESWDLSEEPLRPLMIWFRSRARENMRLSLDLMAALVTAS